MMNLQYINLTDAMERLANDKELYLDLLNMYFDEPQFKPEDLTKLLSQNKNEEASKLVHLLKGIIGTLGADKLYNTCQILEDILKGKKPGDIQSNTNILLDFYKKSTDELQIIRKEL